MRIHNASSRVEPWDSEEERMTKRVMAYADKLRK